MHNKFSKLNVTHKKTDLFRVEYTEPCAIEDFSKQLALTFRNKKPQSEIVCVCIGTDRSTGDALGPITGNLLEKRASSALKIYGTLEHPVHALNLSNTIYQIRQNHPQAFVIAIDACLGHMKSIGYIQLGLGPLKPGAGVKKDLPEIGEVHITGIVNVAGFMEYFVLQNTRLNLVMKMADVISSSVIRAAHRAYMPKANPTMVR
ncbi:spore protease YyaC [Hazenella sp. IB182357]|uniref:Spore protease YyaC n=1 Tax=Polycladospora coralii TaxID=2771432 RepID=A0A926RU04_9BACL|nr:spore protease YyaC [Polycladospora coralii]MBD1371987.1 spore protease YyaC [Polycladospora coralii]